MTASNDLEWSDYLRILRRRWTWTLTPLLIVCGLAVWFTLSQDPRFEASAEVALDASIAEEVVTGRTYVAERDVLNEINFAASNNVEAIVRAELGLLPEMKITAAPDSDKLSFTATASTADKAALFANKWATAYVSAKQTQAQTALDSALEGLRGQLVGLQSEHKALRADLDDLDDQMALIIDEIERARNLNDQVAVAAAELNLARMEVQRNRLDDDLAPELALVNSQITATASAIADLELRAQVSLLGTASVVQIAAPPLESSNAPLARNLALAAVVGAGLGMALALHRQNVDRTIRTHGELVAAIDVPVLGVIARQRKGRRSESIALAALYSPDSPVADGYHKVRTALTHRFTGGQVKSLVITSASPNEGKTTTSSNLAVAFAAIDQRVALVDCDFRSPSLDSIFATSRTPGIADVARGELDLADVARPQPVETGGLVLLPSGALPTNPADFLATPWFAGALRRLETEADLVVIDSPPVLPTADTTTLARQADATVVVARAGRTKRDDLTEAIDQLRQVGALVIGVVLIGAKVSKKYGAYGSANSQPLTHPFTESATVPTMRLVAPLLEAGDEEFRPDSPTRRAR